MTLLHDKQRKTSDLSCFRRVIPSLDQLGDPSSVAEVQDPAGTIEDFNKDAITDLKKNAESVPIEIKVKSKADKRALSP